MRICTIRSLIGLLMLAGSAQSQQIVDIFSNLESSDITLKGNMTDYGLQLDLISNGKVLQTGNLLLDGPGTYIAKWNNFQAEEGSYDACASLVKNETVKSRICYNFLIGGQTPLRFDVRDVYANSKCMHLSISATDPTIVDIYYMLAAGDKAIYVSREKAIPISGGFATPVKIDYPWKQILNNDQEYTGRVKIVELNHNQTRAFQNAFIATDDAIITETYQDETGASATILGNSRVPFEGKLRFTLSQNGTVLTVVEQKTPVLLTGDDETVEISWNHTLEPGVYQLQTSLIGNNGDIRDEMESIIDAKPMAKPVNTTQSEKKSPPPVASGFIALAAAAFLRYLRLKYK